MLAKWKTTGFSGLLMLLVVTGVTQRLDAQTEGPGSGWGRRPPLHTGSGPGDMRRMRTFAGGEIQTGFVFLNGQYLAPPYRIAIDGEDILINGLRVPAATIPRSQQRPGFSGRGGGFMVRRAADRLQGHLMQDGLLIHIDAYTCLLAQTDQAVAVVDILLGSESSEEKATQLAAGTAMELSLDQWATLANAFTGTPELADRLTVLKESVARQISSEDEAAWGSAISVPVMTTIGFGLSVFALGTLLACRPPLAFAPIHRRFRPIYCRQVFYLVGLIVLLNLYDLVCTLYAQGCGGLWEMNPFATRMMDVPAMVVCFKLGMTICPAILLIVTRAHRLAQMASWWGGVLYTVLILRWVTYNGIFLY